MDSFQREERNGRNKTSRSINLPQGESHRDNSMLVKRATSEDVYGAKRPPDLRDMVRARLPESQAPGVHPRPYATTTSMRSRRRGEMDSLQFPMCATYGADDACRPTVERRTSRPYKEPNETPTSRYDVHLERVMNLRHLAHLENRRRRTNLRPISG